MLSVDEITKYVERARRTEDLLDSAVPHAIEAIDFRLMGDGLTSKARAKLVSVRAKLAAWQLEEIEKKAICDDR
jgi:hypothetical protein